MTIAERYVAHYRRLLADSLSEREREQAEAWLRYWEQVVERQRAA